MTTSATLAPLAINTQHVRQQFERRLDRADTAFLYGEVATRLFDRLRLIRLDPQAMMDAGCGVGLATHDLRHRFPKSALISLDHSPVILDRLRQRHRLVGWSKHLTRWRQKSPHEVRCADMADTGVTAESLVLVWSNLAIHWHDRPHDVLKEWARVLRPNGLALFSGWGPATGIELRQALTRLGQPTTTLPLVDMHDLGDLMVQQGFSDPVMDQETLTLTYDTPTALLADAWALGGNPNPDRRAGLTGRRWREDLLAALAENRQADTGKLTLTIEVAYGHAWRSGVRRLANETRISLDTISGRR